MAIRSTNTNKLISAFFYFCGMISYVVFTISLHFASIFSM